MQVEGRNGKFVISHTIDSGPSSCHSMGGRPVSRSESKKVWWGEIRWERNSAQVHYFETEQEANERMPGLPEPPEE